jgi:polyhydroxybutyrate depolymerase
VILFILISADYYPLEKGGIMNRYSFLIPVFIVSLVAAGFPQSLTVSFKFAGVTRNYLMHVPTGELSSPPLLIMLHGHGMDAASQESSSKFYTIADREKFIVAYPNAISNNWDQSDTSKDFPFVLAIIDSIDAKYNIDRNRIYVAGFSQGAGMSQSFGCKYSNVFAAMAAGSGRLSGTCTLKRPVPVFMSFGTKSDIYTPTAFMASVTSWVQYDSLSATPNVTRPYPSSNSKSVITRLTYGPGKNGVLIVVDSAHDGGHEWPMDTITEVNNSEEVWAFFKQFSLSSATGVSKQKVPAAHTCFSATYCSGIVRLQGVGEKGRVCVIDTKGRVITTAIAVQRQFAFKDKPCGVYMVIVSGNDRLITLRMVIP